MQPDVHTLWKIYALLQQMGATSSYTGFFHTAYAVLLTVKEPRRLLLVTKWLYPDVADYFHTSWYAVERNIRTVVNQIWKTHPEDLSRLAGYPLNKRPSSSQFIFILAEYLAAEQSS